jgi:hypothetical protein
MKLVCRAATNPLVWMVDLPYETALLTFLSRSSTNSGLVLHVFQAD